MTQEELAQLSRAELIQIILTQFEQLEKLKADYEALRLKLEKGKKPTTNSSNSSQPPSRDQKRSLPTDRHKRRHGPPRGHPKHERKFVANPDHRVSVKVESCSSCQADLRAIAGSLVGVNQITELPPAKAEVIEVRQYEVHCPECGKSQVCAPPAGLEMDRVFGSRLEATVVYYRQEQHLSYQRTQSALLNLHGLEISQGGIDKIMQRAGSKAVQAVEQIQEQVRQGSVIHCDETGSRVEKYRHRLGERFNFTRGELAVMAVLMLRGPQTAAELRERAGRLHTFEDHSAVESTLVRLSERSDGALTGLT